MISIVSPVFNEEESIREFYKVLIQYLPKISKDYEIIFVDDGSTDRTLSILKELANKNKKIRIFSFRRNLGKAEALTLGFEKAKGNYIVTLDADLQDRPEEMHKLIKELDEGWDVACGWRRDRKDSLPKKLSSKLFNSIASIFWGLRLHDYNCGLKAYKSEAAKSLQLYGGMHRFIPLLTFQNGYTVTEVPIVHEKRKFGKSKYGFSKLWRDLPDIFTMIFLSRYHDRPMHFFGLIGGGFIGLGVVILTYLSILHFMGEAIGQRPLLLLGVLLVLSGFQIFFTGFIADLMLHMKRGSNGNFALKYETE